MVKLSISTKILVALWVCSGCSLERRPQERHIGQLGRFEFQEPDDRMKGVIIGAPHGSAEPASGEYAKWISEKTGAGFVIAYGFGAKRLTVARPLVLSKYNLVASEDPVRRGSIYPEFKKLLEQTAGGAVKFYVGIRFAAHDSDLDSIEIATSGFSFEQVKSLKHAFMRIRDRKLSNMSIPKISIAVEPLDKISQRFITVKHHGELMSAERGLNLRLPKIKATETVKRAYKEVVAEWINAAFRLVDGNGLSPPIEVKLMQYGRIEAIPSRKRQKEIVIGAPLGTFDEYTAEMVMQISQQTGLAAVIAKGFTPTECAGWRINVNRPTERRYPAGEIEIDSKRAKETYQNFKQAALNLAHGSLDLYIDIHQNGQQNNIEVATVSVTKDQAQFIKNIYRKIRDQMLQNAPGVEAVELAIELTRCD